MLSLASLRARWFSLLGSFVAVVLGVTMLTMTALVFFSARPQVPQRFGAVTIAVVSPAADAPADTFAESRPWSPAQVAELVAGLAAIPGVRAAIPDTPFYAQAIIDGIPAEHTIGNSWAAAALAPYRLTSGSAPAHDGEVVVGASLSREPGDRVTILTADGPTEYTVSGTVDAPGYFFRTPGHSGVRVIALLADPGVDPARVRSVVNGRGTVLTGDALARLEPVADARTRWIGMQVLTAMGGLSTFVAVFLVASTFAFSVLQRRRELGLLRTIGATPGQLRRMLSGEALIVGVLAAGAGVGLGALGAPVLGGLLVDAGFEPRSFEVGFGALPLAGAFAVGVLVAQAGVWVAARRAATVRPLEALRAADVERRPMTRSRWVVGVLALAAGAALGVATAGADALSLPTYAGGSAMALVLGLSLLAPVLVPPVARLAMAPFTRGALGLLVRQNAVTSARRTAATAAPVLLTVAFAVLVTGMVQTGAQAYSVRRAASVPASAALVPDGTPGLTDAAVRAAGGVAVLPTTVYHGAVPITAAGVSGLSLLPLEVTAGSLSALHGSDTMAATAWLGWAVGETVPVTVANGQLVRMKVVALLGGGLPYSLVMTREAARRYDPDALTEVVYTDGAVGIGPGTKLVGVATRAADADAEEDRLVWMFTLVLVGMALGFSVIAVANTLLMAAAGRARDLRVLRQAGATGGQTLRMMALETVLVVMLGAVLGMAVAGAGLLGIRAGLSEQMGAPVPLVVAWPVVGLTVAACLAAGLAASLLPAKSLPRSRG